MVSQRTRLHATGGYFVSVRWRYLVVVLLSLAAAAVGGKWLLFSQVASPPAPVSVAAAESFLVIFGVGDTAETNWDGSITVNGANIQILRGWRFTGADSISNNSSWKLSTRTTPSLTPPGPIQENGLHFHIAAARLKSDGAAHSDFLAH